MRTVILDSYYFEKIDCIQRPCCEGSRGTLSSVRIKIRDLYTRRLSILTVMKSGIIVKVLEEKIEDQGRC